MAYIANIFKDICKYVHSPSFFTFFTTILVPTATGLGWGLNLWYVNHIHRHANAHGIHKLDNTTKIRLAEIESGTVPCKLPVWSAMVRYSVLPNQRFVSGKPEAELPVQPYLFLANLWAISTILSLFGTDKPHHPTASL